MGTTVVVVVVVVLLVLVGFVVALARRGRGSAAAALTAPGTSPRAPQEWAGAHSQEAKLHRRLVAVSKSLEAQPLGDAQTIEQRVTLEQQILQLDEQLVNAAVPRGPGRDEAVAEIAPLVDAVEGSVADLATRGVNLDLLKQTQAELDARESDQR